LNASVVVTDKESGNLRLPHRLDEKTGMYRGKLIVTKKEKVVKEKKEKAVKKADTTPKAEKRTKGESKGLLGRMSRGNAKSRSGLGAEG